MFISDKKQLAGYTEILRHEGRLCLLAALFCAIFGGIYELFSHQVYSPYMIGAFAIPLLLGAAPACGLAQLVRGKISPEGREGGASCRHEAPDGQESSYSRLAPGSGFPLVQSRPGSPYNGINANDTKGMNAEMEPYYSPQTYDMMDDEYDGFCLPGRICRNAWFSGIAALTVGCIFRGVLEIYGTTNRLIAVYPVAAAVLMCAAAAAWIIPLATLWRMKLKN